MSILSIFTREQVRAELVRAQRDGSIAVYAGSYNPLLAAKSVKTLAEVCAEVLGTGPAQREATYGEDGGSFWLSQPRLPEGETRLAER